MKHLTLALSLCMAATPILAENPQQRLRASADVLSELMQTPDKGIPQDLLAKAQCIIIFPGVKKAAFIVGGEYGKGFAECRNADGTGWRAPAAVALEGGSVGFQIGGVSTDLILVVRNRHGMQSLLSDKFTLGADVSAAAGPVGRTADADTDAKLNAEILAWSRAKGLFAGVSLNGATIHNDSDTNEALYGKRLTNREILTSDMRPPSAAHPLVAALDRYSMRR
jgi:SH3 domain-containing YSC84-like protein 1